MKPYLRDTTNDLKSGTWKIHLTMKSNFILSKDSNEKLLLHFESDNKEITTSFDTEELVEELFEFFTVFK